MEPILLIFYNSIMNSQTGECLIDGDLMFGTALASINRKLIYVLVL